MSLEKDIRRYKLFVVDTGLFITLAFKDKAYTDNIIYNKLLSDKLEVNLGNIYENIGPRYLQQKDTIFSITQCQAKLQIIFTK